MFRVDTSKFVQIRSNSNKTVRDIWILLEMFSDSKFWVLHAGPNWTIPKVDDLNKQSEHETDRPVLTLDDCPAQKAVQLCSPDKSV